MPAYFVAQLNVHDPEEYARYLEGTGPLLRSHGAKVLAVEESPVVLEGEWPYGRTVIIEFPTPEHLRRWYDSPGYREVSVHRHAASTGNAVGVRGRD